MAKARATAPGTYVTKGIHCTMDAPFDKAGKGTQKNLTGTFDQARSGGDNGLPTRVTDPTGGPKPGGTGQTAKVSSPGTIMTERSKK